MSQPELPRYHDPEPTIAMSLNETKYKNMRLVLLVTLILSVVNCITMLIANIFFYFSAFLPLIFISIGVMLTETYQTVLFYVIMAVIALASLVPYLLCYLFSKKKVGWMITALVLFSVDTLLLLLWVLMTFDISLMVSLAIHIYLIVLFALGVKYGLNLQKEKDTVLANGADASTAGYGAIPSTFVPQPDGSYADASAQEYANVRRKITVVRKKAFAGCAVALLGYAGNRQLFKLKNGETVSFEVTGEPFILRLGTANGLVAGQIQIPAGDSEIGYEVCIKIGVVADTIEARQIY